MTWCHQQPKRQRSLLPYVLLLIFTFTQVKSKINTSAFTKAFFPFILQLKYRMQVRLPSLVLGSHKFTKRSTPAEMTGLNELISEWGLPLMDSVLHVAQRKRRSCHSNNKKMEIQQRPLKKAPGTSLLFKSHVLHLRKQFICLCSI